MDYFQAKMKFSENFTAELANKSSPAFTNLAKDVKAGLLPALKAENPSVDDVEITGFEKGKSALTSHKNKCIKFTVFYYTWTAI